MIQEYFKALFFIFIAEMGDKTQILAMTFATKYNIKKVILGVFIGSLANHGIAVALGSSISNFLPINLIQFFSGILFIIFGFWSLKIDNSEDEKGLDKFGPIITISIAYFIGELGDKTQLTAITLSSDSQLPFLTLAGTVSGMVISGSFGILIGSKLGKKIPEFTIKSISSIIFLAFGITKIFSVIHKKYFTTLNITLTILIIFVIFSILFLKSYKIYKNSNTTKFKEISEKLYQYYSKMKENIDKICLGTENCINCSGSECIIGYTKLLIEHASTENSTIEIVKNLEKFKLSINKNFDIEKLKESLIYTVNFLENNKSENNIYSNEIRVILEKILFGKTLSYKNINDYLDEIKKYDFDLSNKMLNYINKNNIH